MMKLLEPTEEQRDIIRAVEEICQGYDDDYWLEKDQNEEFPMEFWDTLTEYGWAGMNVPEDYGGGGMGMTEVELVVETVSRNCGYSAGDLFTLGPNFGTESVKRYGGGELKDEILPKMVDGTIVGIGLTEPEAGLDVANIDTKGEKDGNEWVINGQKVFQTGAHVADYILAVVRTTPMEDVKKRHQGISLFLIPTSLEGIEMNRLETVSFRCLGENEVFMDNIRVPEKYLVGGEGKGFYQILSLLNQERITMAAMGVGAGYKALDIATEYVKERETWGRPIGQNQAIQFPLAETYIELEAARLYTRKAARLLDQEKDTGEAANSALYLASKAGHKAADTAIQVHGGWGFSEEYTVERLWRDTRLGLVAPVSKEMIFHYIATQVLGLPRSF